MTTFAVGLLLTVAAMAALALGLRRGAPGCGRARGADAGCRGCGPDDGEGS